MKKKALITGASGFVGKHLYQELLNNGYEVIGTDINESDINMDITDYKRVREVLDQVRPDIICHLAAIAFVKASWQDPLLVSKVNYLGSLNLFNAILSAKIDPIIQIACSSEEYGEVHPNEIPIKESNPLRPLSPYGVSKAAMDFLGYVYYKSYGMKVVRTRAFNHEGYGRGEVYAPSAFCKRAVQIEKGLEEAVLYHGNLDAERDFTDVRDMVWAYRLAVELCEPGEVYNIGSGIKHSIREVLEIVKNNSSVPFECKLDPKILRPADVMVLLCDSSKFREKTGWEPRYTLEDTLNECLRYWRKKL
jgi:GDP-4-dehydro-6-deoxy-D-mannose reductase